MSFQTFCLRSVEKYGVYGFPLETIFMFYGQFKGAHSSFQNSFQIRKLEDL